MKKNQIILTDEEVELEIERLNQSAEVRLARKEISMKYKRRRYLYQLRNLEKRGKSLQKAGITFEMLDSMESDIGCEEATNNY